MPVKAHDLLFVHQQKNLRRSMTIGRRRTVDQCGGWCSAIGTDVISQWIEPNSTSTSRHGTPWDPMGTNIGRSLRLPDGVKAHAGVHRQTNPKVNLPALRRVAQKASFSASSRALSDLCVDPSLRMAGVDYIPAKPRAAANSGLPCGPFGTMSCGNAEQPPRAQSPQSPERGRLAATKRSLTNIVLWHQRCTDGDVKPTVPAPRDADDQVQGESFSARRSRENAQRSRRRDSMALRAEFGSGLVRSAKILLLSASSHVLPAPLCWKTSFLILDQQPEPASVGPRPANAKRAACREATHDERSPGGSSRKSK